MIHGNTQIVNAGLFPRDSEAVGRLQNMEALPGRALYLAEIRAQVAQYRALALHGAANENTTLQGIYTDAADALELALDDIEAHWLPLMEIAGADLGWVG